MKLFKKFLLAAATVGLVSSVGFASKTQAAGDVKVTIDSVANTATIESVSGNQVILTAGGKQIFSTTDPAVSVNGITVEKISEKTKGKGITGETATISATVKGEGTWEKTGEASTKLYLVKVTATNGTVEPANGAYEFPGNAVTFSATPASGYVMDKWDDGSTASTNNIYVLADPAKNTAHTVVFKSSSAPTQAYLNYTVKHSTGVEDTDTVTTLDKRINMKVGETISLSTNTDFGVASGTQRSDYFDGNWALLTAKRSGSLRVIALGKDDGYPDYVRSKWLTIDISDDFKASDFKIKGDDYVTGDKDKDYCIDLTPTDVVEGTGYKAYGITWEVSNDSKATLTGLSTNSKTGTSVSDIKGVRVKYTGDSIDAGKTATIEVKATIKNGKAASGTDADFVLTHKITVYPKFSLTYSSDKRTLSYKAPAKINTGTTSGQDSDNKDATKTAFEVKGIKLDPMVGGSVVNDIISLSKTKSLGTDKTIDASTIESIVIELNKKNKFSGDSCDLVFRAYPCDTDGKYNKEIKAEQTATVYKVVLHVTTSASSGTDKTTNKNSGGGVATLAPLPVALISPVGTTVATAAGTATDYVFYLLPGQEISEDVIASIYPALKGVKLTDAAGNSITKITGSSSVTSNNYNGVLGVKTTATADSAPDGQQKWGQGNTFAYIMMILVICGVCAGLYALNRKKSNI